MYHHFDFIEFLLKITYHSCLICIMAAIAAPSVELPTKKALARMAESFRFLLQLRFQQPAMLSYGNAIEIAKHELLTVRPGDRSRASRRRLHEHGGTVTQPPAGLHAPPQYLLTAIMPHGHKRSLPAFCGSTTRLPSGRQRKNTAVPVLNGVIASAWRQLHHWFLQLRRWIGPT